jgi:DNA polymerase
MGIGDDMETAGGWQAALQALIWQHDLGVTDAVGDTPVSRYELTAEAPRPPAPRAPITTKTDPRPRQPDSPRPAADFGGSPVDAAKAAAQAATTLDDLQAAMAAFEHCDLKRGAKTLVFADGNPAARVMLIGEAPGREEDQVGRPFVGPAGQLLDRMFAAIGLTRGDPDPAKAFYITNVVPWRPPQNRDPEAVEIAMMLPFLTRHVELVDPDLIVVLGNTPLFATRGIKGITRLRGTWTEAFGKPMLPMLHPAYLFRMPAAKRDTWADLLSLKARLEK